MRSVHLGLYLPRGYVAVFKNYTVQKKIKDEVIYGSLAKTQEISIMSVKPPGPVQTPKSTQSKAPATPSTPAAQKKRELTSPDFPGEQKKNKPYLSPELPMSDTMSDTEEVSEMDIVTNNAVGSASETGDTGHVKS